MVPIGSGHGGSVSGVARRLFAACDGVAHVAVQSPVRLDEGNEPQPDFGVYRPRADGYFDSHPGPSDTLLLVEVSDNSPSFDRAVKVPLYARFGIPEVWIVDVVGRRLESLSAPVAGAFTVVRRYGPGDRVPLVALPGVVVPLAGVFRPDEGEVR